MTSTPDESRRRRRATVIGAVVIGSIAVAFLAATVGAFQAHDEAQRKLLVKIGGVLVLLLGIVPKSRAPTSQRTRLLQLGWTLFLTIGLIFAACLYWSILTDLFVSPWGYVFLGVALGMVVWGYSLPKEQAGGARHEDS